MDALDDPLDRGWRQIRSAGGPGLDDHEFDTGISQFHMLGRVLLGCEGSVKISHMFGNGPLSLAREALLCRVDNAHARPTAQERGRSLAALESRLRQCGDDPGHYFSTGGSCPWCRIFNDGGPNFFIAVSLNL